MAIHLLQWCGRNVDVLFTVFLIAMGIKLAVGVVDAICDARRKYKALITAK